MLFVCILLLGGGDLLNMNIALHCNRSRQEGSRLVQFSVYLLYSIDFTTSRDREMKDI